MKKKETISVIPALSRVIPAKAGISRKLAIIFALVFSFNMAFTTVGICNKGTGTPNVYELLGKIEEKLDQQIEILNSLPEDSIPEGFVNLTNDAWNMAREAKTQLEERGQEILEVIKGMEKISNSSMDMLPIKQALHNLTLQFNYMDSVMPNIKHKGLQSAYAKLKDSYIQFATAVTFMESGRQTVNNASSSANNLSTGGFDINQNPGTTEVLEVSKEVKAGTAPSSAQPNKNTDLVSPSPNPITHIPNIHMADKKDPGSDPGKSGRYNPEPDGLVHPGKFNGTLVPNPPVKQSNSPMHRKGQSIDDGLPSYAPPPKTIFAMPPASEMQKKINEITPLQMTRELIKLDIATERAIKVLPFASALGLFNYAYYLTPKGLFVKTATSVAALSILVFSLFTDDVNETQKQTISH
jgi:hypothetical protein